MTKAKQKEQAEAIERLRKILKPGDTVQVYVRHVSRSGMSRVIVPIKANSDGSTFQLGKLAALALDYREDGNHGVKIGGCGMDMGFHLVYSLSRRLWPDGYGCTGEGCRSNDHSNGDRDYTPHAAKSKGAWSHLPGQFGGPMTLTCADCGDAEARGCEKHSHWHSDGGYALRHSWI